MIHQWVLLIPKSGKKSFGGTYMTTKNSKPSPIFRNSGRLFTAVACISLTAGANAATVSLGTAIDFAVLGGSTVTNTGPSVITGDVGLIPGTSVTGFPPGSVDGSIHIGDGVAGQAKTDAQAAFVDMAGRSVTQDLTGQDLGGLILTPGVYFFSTTAQLTGQLTLDGQGLTEPLFIFQIGTALTTASSSSILGINGVVACDVFFMVGSSATLGTDSTMMGTIIASESITANSRASVDGRLLALAGAVTLDTNRIIASECIPEATTSALFLLGGLAFATRRGRTLSP